MPNGAIHCAVTATNSQDREDDRARDGDRIARQQPHARSRAVRGRRSVIGVLSS